MQKVKAAYIAGYLGLVLPTLIAILIESSRVDFIYIVLLWIFLALPLIGIFLTIYFFLIDQTIQNRSLVDNARLWRHLIVNLTMSLWIAIFVFAIPMVGFFYYGAGHSSTTFWPPLFITVLEVGIYFLSCSGSLLCYALVCGVLGYFVVRKRFKNNTVTA
jgi:hypothetical protein